jgi:hypothetical protein
MGRIQVWTGEMVRAHRPCTSSARNELPERDYGVSGVDWRRRWASLGCGLEAVLRQDGCILRGGGRNWGVDWRNLVEDTDVVLLRGCGLEEECPF